MYKLYTALLITLAVIVPVRYVSADDKPTPGSYEAVLLQRLAAATSEADGRLAESAVWEHWFSVAPDDNVHDWLQQGRKKRESYDYEAAEELFDRVVKAAPHYSEGYNQRAFVRFLRENLEGSLADLEKTLEIRLLRQAVTIHPWIQERGALPKNLWPDSYRRIHEPEQEI
jgi:tetratricopeptide (TPR) repeat protein